MFNVLEIQHFIKLIHIIDTYCTCYKICKKHMWATSNKYNRIITLKQTML